MHEQQQFLLKTYRKLGKIFGSNHHISGPRMSLTETSKIWFTHLRLLWWSQLWTKETWDQVADGVTHDNIAISNAFVKVAGVVISNMLLWSSWHAIVVLSKTHRLNQNFNKRGSKDHLSQSLPSWGSYRDQQSQASNYVLLTRSTQERNEWKFARKLWDGI